MKTGYSTIFGILSLKIVALLPFAAIYLLADLFYLVVYYIIGYRRKVVFENLRNSFPEKKEEELDEISKKYYRHFADLMIETIKNAWYERKGFQKANVN